MDLQLLQPFLIIALISFTAGLILGVRLVVPHRLRVRREEE